MPKIALMLVRRELKYYYLGLGLNVAADDNAGPILARHRKELVVGGAIKVRKNYQKEAGEAD